MTARLPDGFAVELDPRTRRLDDGTVLLGGSPPRLLRLAPAARALLTSGRLDVTDARTAGLARTLLDAGVAHPRPVTGPRADEVTVVVPVRDNPTGLTRLLAALPDAPVVVVDDGSRPPVPERAGVTVLRHPRSRGPAAARNTGLAAARTPYVAFLDSDVLPVAGWLELLGAHLSDPAVALVAPRVVSDRTGGGWLARYEAVRSSLDLGRREAPVVPLSRVAYVPSAALLVRRAATGDGARGSAAFDERMTVAEDVDLCLRLHAQGWRLRYEPRAEVAHTHRTAPRAWWVRKAFYGTGAAPLARRHPGLVPPVALAPWTAAAVTLAATGRRGGLLAAAGVTAAATVRMSRALPVRRPLRTAAVLAPRGLVGAGRQLASAAWRHWWPLAAAGSLASRRVRRVVLLAGLAEGVGDWAGHRADGGPSLPVHLLLKRADDLAYGAGLWLGAWRERSPAALLPRLRSQS